MTTVPSADTGVFGESQLAIIPLQLHLVLCLPAFVVCIGSLLKVNVLQVVCQVICAHKPNIKVVALIYKPHPPIFHHGYLHLGCW